MQLTMQETAIQARTNKCKCTYQHAHLCPATTSAHICSACECIFSNGKYMKTVITNVDDMLTPTFRLGGCSSTLTVVPFN